MGSLSADKLRHALLLLALAESPIVLQLLHLDRSYLFFVFSLAWAAALYTFLEPPRRALTIGLLVYVATAAIAVPLFLAWLAPATDPAADEPPAHLLWGYVFGVGVREELCKAAALFLLLALGRALGHRFTRREGMLYGAMSGLAFAAAENLQELKGLGHLDEVALAHGLPANTTVAVALTRLALTPLAHACWSGTVGYLGCVPLPRHWLRPLAVAGGVLVAGTLHGLYDEAATTGNRLGVGLLLAVSFGLTLILISRTHPDGPTAGLGSPRLASPTPPA